MLRMTGEAGLDQALLSELVGAFTASRGCYGHLPRQRADARAGEAGPDLALRGESGLVLALFPRMAKPLAGEDVR